MSRSRHLASCRTVPRELLRHPLEWQHRVGQLLADGPAPCEAFEILESGRVTARTTDAFAPDREGL